MKLPDFVNKAIEITASSRPFVLAFCWTWTFVFLEWLFLVTKPSFLSTLTGLSKVSLLLNTATGLAFSAGCIALIFDLSARENLRNPFMQKILQLCSYLPGSFIVASLALIVVDNFTYAVFAFNVFYAKGVVALVYILIFLLMNALVLHKSMNNSRSPDLLDHRFVHTILFSLIAFTSVWLPLQHLIIGEAARLTKPSIEHKPNILIFSADGVNANHMSAYGYARDTTPFLNEFANSSLLFEKHLTNSGNTTGAIAALLTGKLPLNTRVIYPPDILKGRDCLEHLPGILRENDYLNIDIGERHYADARDLNLRNGFQWGNGRKIHELFNIKGLEYEAYLLELMHHRIWSRLLHIFHIERTQNPFDIVAQVQWGEGDTARMSQLFEGIERSGHRDTAVFRQDRPFFAHIHLLGTHGAKFEPTQAVFSKGKTQDDYWMDDYYDDAILDMDRRFEQAVAHLKELGIYGETLIIFNSDHGQNWRTDRYLPLIIKFPNNEHTGRSSVTSQRVDIPTTILDYLGSPIPEWMDGQSLIDSPQEQTIFMVKNGDTSTIGELVFAKNYIAPFYSLGSVSIAFADESYALSLISGSLSHHTLDGSEARAKRNRQDVYKQLFEYLVENGYPRSKIPPLMALVAEDPIITSPRNP